MAKPKYRRKHQKERARIKTTLIDVGKAFCVEPVCLMRSRWIPPGTPGHLWDVAHDTTGTIVLGPAHAKCNRSEGAKRGNRARGQVNRPTAGRWVL